MKNQPSTDDTNVGDKLSDSDEDLKKENEKAKNLKKEFEEIEAFK